MDISVGFIYQGILLVEQNNKQSQEYKFQNPEKHLKTNPRFKGLGTDNKTTKSPAYFLIYA